MRLLERLQAWSDRQTLWLHQPIQTYLNDAPLECRACRSISSPAAWPCPEARDAMQRQVQREQEGP